MPSRSSTQNFTKWTLRACSSRTCWRPSSGVAAPYGMPRRASPGGPAIDVAAIPFPTVRNCRGVRDVTSSRSAIRQVLIGLEAHAHRRRRSVVGVALQLIDQVVARVVRLGVAAVLLVDQPDVVVAVDERRNHGLAGQITRVAPAGGCRSPLLPTQVKESPSTRNAELSMTGVVSPTIRRAPFEPQRGAARLRRQQRGSDGRDAGMERILSARSSSSPACGGDRRIALRPSALIYGRTCARRSRSSNFRPTVASGTARRPWRTTPRRAMPSGLPA